MAQNQTTSDLLINLFKGYSAVSDETLRGWLTWKQEAHEEGTEEVTPDQLMKSAKNKYNTLVENGKWNSPTAKEKIVALEAKLTLLLKNINKKVVRIRQENEVESAGTKKTPLMKSKVQKDKEELHPKKRTPQKSGYTGVENQPLANVKN